MGLMNCFQRDKKEQFIKYEKFLYCHTCLGKIKYGKEYLICHCMNQTFIFCCRECHGKWVVAPAVLKTI